MTGDRRSEPRAALGLWAGRYLERLAEPFDDWEADSFRRGCGFLARGLSIGAASCWRSMTLPSDRREEVYGRPVATRSLTVAEIARLRTMLFRITQAEIPPEG
jgi:hypothetical protein